MPGVNWGVYKYGGIEGTEVSSTYEGRHITCTAAELITDGGLGVAVKGHACIFGLVGLQAVGVCFNSGTTTDLIAIDTEGIWNLPVTGKDDAGNRALLPGEPVFINNTTCEISGIRNNATQVPFGYLLTEAATTVETISVVKVHWDPRAHWLMDDEWLYFGDARDVSMGWDEANFTVLPVVDDTGSFIIGDGAKVAMDFRVYGLTVADFLFYDCQTGELQLTMTALGPTTRMLRIRGTSATPNYGDGIGCNEYQLDITGDMGGITALNSNWLNLGAASVIDSYLFVNTDGIWDGGGNLTLCYAAWTKITFNLASDPAYLSIFEMNAVSANDTINAIFNVNRADYALGYVAGGVSTVIGSIPFFSTAHGALRGWIAIYDAEFA